MRQGLRVLAVGVLSLSLGCASPELRQDCVARQQRAEQVAALAGSTLSVGLTANQVRALLGEPMEIVTAKGLGDFDIWKYYLMQDCRAHLGIEAPTTELFFLNGNLVKWATFIR
jgi:hypothetical protein